MALPATYSETEVQIFEAALKTFARKGRDGARMQEIADAAGINKAMLHYYFRSKDKLYADVLRYVMGRFVGAFGEALRDAATFGEVLRVFIDAYIRFLFGNPDVFRLIVHENLAGGEVMGALVGEFVRETELAPPRLLGMKIAEAVARGEIRPVEPVHLLLTVMGGCALPILMAPMVRGFNPSLVEDWPAFVEARKRHLFEVLYEGLRVHPSES